MRIGYAVAIHLVVLRLRTQIAGGGMLAGMDEDAGASTHQHRMNGSTNAQTQRQERSACIASWAAAGLGRAAEGTQPCTRRQADCHNVPQQNVPQQSQRMLCRVERVRMCLSRLGIRGDRTGGGGADHARDAKLGRQRWCHRSRGLYTHLFL